MTALRVGDYLLTDGAGFTIRQIHPAGHLLVITGDRAVYEFPRDEVVQIDPDLRS